MTWWMCSTNWLHISYRLSQLPDAMSCESCLLTWGPSLLIPRSLRTLRSFWCVGAFRCPTSGSSAQTSFWWPSPAMTQAEEPQVWLLTLFSSRELPDFDEYFKRVEWNTCLLSKLSFLQKSLHFLGNSAKILSRQTNWKLTIRYPEQSWWWIVTPTLLRLLPERF